MAAGPPSLYSTRLRKPLLRPWSSTKITLAAIWAPRNTASSIPRLDTNEVGALRPPEEADPVVLVPPAPAAAGALLPPWSFHSGKYSGGLRVLMDVGVCECPVDR
jgi:hypothetical protein